VVLPWSTWAIIATLRIFSFAVIGTFMVARRWKDP
jgi:hypothetical protein